MLPAHAPAPEAQIVRCRNGERAADEPREEPMNAKLVIALMVAAILFLVAPTLAGQ